MCASSFLTASAPEALLHLPYIRSPVSRCQLERGVASKKATCSYTSIEKDGARETG